MIKDKKFWPDFRNLIFPRRCIFCRRILPLSAEVGVCTDCMKTLPFCLAYNRCAGCGRPIPDGERFCSHCKGTRKRFLHKVSAAYCYKESAKQALLRFKRERFQSFASVFAKHMAVVLGQDCPHAEFDIVVAVPPRKERMQKENYDQARTLAGTLAKELGIPFRGGVLCQIENGRKQSDLTLEERWCNVQGNFRVVLNHVILEKRILLVDDICTTGATLNECAKVLREAGAKTVYSAVAAIVAEE